MSAVSSIAPIARRGAPRIPSSYQSMVFRILNDRAGTSTWQELEQLDKKSAHDPAAARAMRTLEAHHACREFVPGKTDAGSLVKTLESACRPTQKKCWRELMRSHGRVDVLPLMQCSRRGVGPYVLGLPKRFGRVVATAGRGSIERLEDWNSLLDQNLRHRLLQGNSDPRLGEYRRLYQAYQEARTGKYRGKVSECALFMDMKELEETLLPEQVHGARKEVKDKLLGSTDAKALHSQSKVRRLLGSMASLPPNSRETFLFRELAAVALSDPRELSYYSRMILEELKCGPARVQARVLPKFERALSTVKEIYLNDKGTRRASSPASLEQLLSGIAERRPAAQTENQDEDLDYFRSKLTVNGYVKNYTYL